MTAPDPCGARGPQAARCSRPAGHNGGHVAADGTYWQAEAAEARS